MNKEYLLNFLKPDSIVLEAGAHIGTDTVELSKIFHKGKIHCFEPVTDIFHQLAKNVAHLPNVHLYQMALDNITSKKNMYVSSGDSNASSSLLTPTEHLNIHPTVYYNHYEEVQTTTVNDWVQKNRIKKIDFLWFDLEGNEYNVLSKANKILPKVKAIYSEIAWTPRYLGEKVFEEYRLYLESLGFIIALDESNSLGNVLFVRKKHLKRKVML